MLFKDLWWLIKRMSVLINRNLLGILVVALVVVQILTWQSIVRMYVTS